MESSTTYKPFKFFFFTYLLTWVSWFSSAYFSFRENGESIYVIIMLPWLIAPLGTAGIMADKFFNHLLQNSVILASTAGKLLELDPDARLGLCSFYQAYW